MLEKKTYTSSCHKHQRGYIHKLNQMMHNRQKLQDQHGIVKFNIIAAQNNTKAMHNISNKYHYRNIKPLAESRIALEGIALNVTGTGYIPRICLEEREIILVECL
jgi:superoxide dismutase